MPGTKEGGAAAAKTNKEKYGDDFYKRIGSIGGQMGTTGGFAANRELARKAGAKGGRISRRTSAKLEGYKCITDNFEITTLKEYREHEALKHTIKGQF